MIEIVRDLRAINVLAKFENDPWKIVDVRVLTGLVCPAARPLGPRQYPEALKGCGIIKKKVPWCMAGSPTRDGGETFPAFPVHAQILRIW